MLTTEIFFYQVPYSVFSLNYYLVFYTSLQPVILVLSLYPFIK